MNKNEAMKIIEKNELRLKKQKERMRKLREVQEYREKDKKYMKEYRLKEKEKLELAKKYINKVVIYDNEKKCSENNNKLTLKETNINYKSEPLWKKRGYKGVSEKTNIQYSKIILRIHKNYTNKDLNTIILKNIFSGKYSKDDEKYILNELNYLKIENVEKFIDYIKSKYTNCNSLASNIKPFNVIASYIEELIESYYKLSNILINENKKYEYERDNNEISEKDSYKLIDFHSEKIEKKLESIENTNDRLLFSLYTLIPPRRLEYSSITIIDNENNINNKDNYLLIDKNNTKLIFNNYKTNETFGTQEITNLPVKLINEIYKYLEINNKNIGDKLFTKYNKTEELSNAALGKRIKNLFTKLYNEEITLRYIRISYATYINSLNLSNNELKRESTLMCHSVKTNSRYNKKKIN